MCTKKAYKYSYQQDNWMIYYTYFLLEKITTEIDTTEFLTKWPPTRQQTV